MATNNKYNWTPAPEQSRYRNGPQPRGGKSTLVTQQPMSMPTPDQMRPPAQPVQPAQPRPLSPEQVRENQLVQERMAAAMRRAYGGDGTPQPATTVEPRSRQVYEPDQMLTLDQELLKAKYEQEQIAKNIRWGRPTSPEGMANREANLRVAALQDERRMRDATQRRGRTPEEQRASRGAVRDQARAIFDNERAAAVADRTAAEAAGDEKAAFEAHQRALAAMAKIEEIDAGMSQIDQGVLPQAELDRRLETRNARVRDANTVADYLAEQRDRPVREEIRAREWQNELDRLAQREMKSGARANIQENRAKSYDSQADTVRTDADAAEARARIAEANRQQQVSDRMAASGERTAEEIIQENERKQAQYDAANTDLATQGYSLALGNIQGDLKWAHTADLTQPDAPRRAVDFYTSALNIKRKINEMSPEQRSILIGELQKTINEYEGMSVRRGTTLGNAWGTWAEAAVDAAGNSDNRSYPDRLADRNAAIDTIENGIRVLKEIVRSAGG